MIYFTFISWGKDPEANSKVRLFLDGHGLAATASRDTGFPWTTGCTTECEAWASEEFSIFDSGV